MEALPKIKYTYVSIRCVKTYEDRIHDMHAICNILTNMAHSNRQWSIGKTPACLSIQDVKMTDRFQHKIR